MPKNLPTSSVAAILGLAALLVLTACRSAPPEAPPTTLSGTLRHHDLGVKSVRAWHGTEFTLDGKAVLPSAKVSREYLLKHVGQAVEVTGRMEAGEPWTPDPNDVSSHPISDLSGDGGIIHRGGGIRLMTLRRIAR